MTLPTLGLRAAFASNPFDPTPIWTEIGADVRKAKTARGRQRLLRSVSQFQAGTFEASLRNLARRYDPTNTNGPYYPNLQPEKLIQLYAVWAATEYKLWTGYADDWPQVWAGFAEADVPLTATDLFKQLAIKRLGSAGYRNAVIADGAVGYWRLGDPAGSVRLLDSSPNANHAYVLGNPTFGVPGGLVPTDPDAAMQIDPTASSTSGIVAPSPLGTATSFSIEFLLKNAVTSGFYLWEQPIAYLNSTNPFANTLQIAVNAAGVINAKAVSGGVFYGPSSPAPVTGPGFHHVVVTVTPSLITLYVDGVLQASAAGSPSPYISASDWFAFGEETGFFNTGVTATVDELAIYPTALSATQVANHFRLMTWPTQTTGARANQILDTIGHPAAQRRIDTGRTLCGPDTTDESQTKSLTLLQKCEQTEQGQAFVGADGFAVFQDRYHRYASPNSTSKATFGDGGAAFPAEIPYQLGGVKLNFDRAELFNEIPVTRRTGTTQTAIDAASVTAFTERTMPGLADLLMATDVDALWCAQWILADTKVPQFRVSDLVVNPHADPTRLWPLVLGLEIGDVVTINKHNIPGPGPNLLTAVDSEFETGIGTWAPAGLCTIAQSATRANRGTFALKLTPTGAGTMQALPVTLRPVTPNSDVTVSAFIYEPDAGQSAYLQLLLYDAVGTYLGLGPVSAALPLTQNQFTFVSFTTRVPSTAFQAIASYFVTSPGVNPAWIDTAVLQETTVRQSLPALSLLCRIEGIEHQIDQPNLWLTTWHLSLMGTQPWLIFNDPVVGFFDIGARFGW